MNAVTNRSISGPQIFFLVLWCGLLAIAPRQMLRDPGTFWHTVVGEEILSTGEPVTVDEFTFTHQGEPWIAQQWLGEVIMAMAHRFSGLDGIVLLAVTILASIYAFVFSKLLKNGVPAFLAIVLTVLTIAASSYHFIPRPHLFTILGMAWLTSTLVDVEQERRSPRRLLLLPVVFLFWVNIHGGALGGLATLLIFGLLWLIRPYSGNETVTGYNAALHRRTLTMLTIGASLSIATVLLNPYGPALPRTWISLMGSELLPNVIVEHAPLDLLAPEGLMILVIAGIYFTLLISLWRRHRRAAWLLPAIWFFLALSRVRHGPLFAVCAMIVIADMIPFHAGLARRFSISPEETGRARLGIRPILIPAYLVGLALFFQSAGLPFPIFGAGRCTPSPVVWPIEATEALKKHESGANKPINVFNDMRFAGYLIYSMPEAKVYIDDRCELHRDVGIERYLELRRHPERFPGESQMFGIDAAMVSADTPIAHFLRSTPDWSRIHTDALCELFVRTQKAATAMPLTRTLWP